MMWGGGFLDFFLWAVLNTYLRKHDVVGVAPRALLSYILYFSSERKAVSVSRSSVPFLVSCLVVLARQDVP